MVKGKELKGLTASRSFTKGAITRIINFTLDDDCMKEATLFELSTKKERLVKLFSEYESVSKQIFCLDESDKDVEAVEERYFSALARLEEQIHKSTGNDTSHPEDKVNSQHKTRTKLPTIDINPFSGKYSEYVQFMSLFKSLIDSDNRLDNIQKLHYLRSLLKNEPHDLIKNLPLVSASYSESLQLLEDRYFNKNKITNDHISSLLDMNAMTRSTPSQIREFVSNVKQTLAALKNLGAQIDSWDPILMCILHRKLDQQSARAYQLERNADMEPTVNEFLDFLQRRALALENAEQSTSSRTGYHQHQKAVNVAAVTAQECKYCNAADHKLFLCKKFKLLPCGERLKFVKENVLCKVCLNAHKGKCKYYFKCAICKGLHNTLIHQDAEETNKITLMTGTTNNILLPTARIKLISKDNTEVHIKAILDSASQASLVSKKVVEVLGLTPVRDSTNIIGVTNLKNNTQYSIPLEVHSLKSQFKITINCHVVENITCKIPQTRLDCSKINIPPGIKLADDDYDQPSDIHMLMGADIFFQVLLPNETSMGAAQECQHVQRENGEPGQGTRSQSTDECPCPGPKLVNTQFGHIIGGALQEPKNKKSRKVVSLLCVKCNSNIDNNLKRFWETESVPQVFSEQISEHELTEQIFQSTIKLDNDKFTVDLPLKIPLNEVSPTLGNSFDLALYRFLNLEKKLQKNVNLLTEYTRFIHEYVDLGHAHNIDFDSIDFSQDPIYFLPHHAVINENSKTTRTRVVFDGSMKTSNKISLNNILLNGPTVQRDLFDIMMLYRVGDYTFNSDIKRMFRNVLISPEYASLQNILWRDNPKEPIQCLRLDTVTYGLKSSTYLATRCLIELANKYDREYPLASHILKNCTYVDDILYSNSDLSIMIKAKDELVDLLSKGSFNLHKWSSNCEEILNGIPQSQQQFDEIDLQTENYSIKALGMTIDTRKDCFVIKSPDKLNSNVNTKREILSHISKFYDPLGLVSPIIIKAKVILQRLWEDQIPWDAVPNKKCADEWLQFANGLGEMEPIYLNRNVPVPHNAEAVQLIGFADASSSTGYGCCVYLRVLSPTGKAKSYLLCSKSRINPLAKPLTVPRLELNACLLLAKLMSKVHSTLSIKLKIDSTFLFSDSQIALAWINSDPIKLNAYIANRVKVVQQLTNRWRWLYVSTHENPADLISRGVDPRQLAGCSMWWNGPPFLEDREYTFESLVQLPNDLPESKNNLPSGNVVLLTQKQEDCSHVIQGDLSQLLQKYSNINKMTRVLAYTLRFCHNIKNKKDKINFSYLTSKELNTALLLIIKHEQNIYFNDEIKSLLNKDNVKGHLSALHPYLDSEKNLRVGGRLQNAEIPFSQKHPLILPKASHITELIIHHEHLRLLHAGPKLLLSHLNQKYWIVNGIRQVKKVTHRCIVCFRLKASATEQLMGSLPQQRVTISKPFDKVGIDYAGPVYLKNSRIRRAIETKGYICVLVCFATKAIHLELASDLSSDTFLACFKRFISRRGLPSEVFCDNGTAFVGAKNQLVELYKLNSSKQHQSQVIDFTAQQGITFHFTPSYSPVFAGLAEAAVKSTKFHLKRTLEKRVLTYEQLITVLCQIEGILNSRPLLPLSASDITDFTYLTPGHFLIGRPIVSYPEPDITQIPQNRLKFWQLVEQIRQMFWKVWSKNYLNILQCRPKWRNDLPNVKVGALVILREPNTPPLYWPMARISKVFPGKDGKVRALEVVTPNKKTYKRSLSGICLLPIEN